MTRTTMGLGIVAMLLAAAIGVWIGRSTAKQTPLEQHRAQKLREYCGQVNAGMYIDIRDFTSGVPVRQQGAVNRFRQLTTFHSEQEIELCSDTMPKFEHCDRPDDYFACLANAARRAYDATKQH